MDNKTRKHLDNLRSEDRDVENAAFSAQILANLAKSDPENRRQKDFPALMAVTKDEKFVTARHSLQSFWKVVTSRKMRQPVVNALANRFRDCTTEKNWTLIRYESFKRFAIFRIRRGTKRSESQRWGSSKQKKVRNIKEICRCLEIDPNEPCQG